MDALNLRRRPFILMLVVVVLAACGGEAGVEALASQQAESPAAHPAEEHAETRDEHGEGEAGLVALTEAAHRTAGIETAAVEERSLRLAMVGGAVPGEVEFDPARVALISPRTSGRIERLLVVEGESVRAGEPVAEILSTAFLTAQQDFLQAMARAALLEGTADAEGAAALVDAAVRRLRLMGAGETLIDALARDGRPGDLLPVSAPFAGRIAETHTLSGAAVEPGTAIFTLADISVVNVAADVPERSLPDVRVGQTVAIRLAAYPGRRWNGRVARIKDELNRDTRTATALIQVANADGVMRPGMFASIEMGAESVSGGLTTALAVPASAIVTDGAERYVFIEAGERSYERRDVDVVPTADREWVAVLDGLAAGERVVVSGAFTLKAELAKAAFGDHHH
ncbi:MAG: efflux RND transporter periplasmic adaptor subunit [Longimicrobiales bacterium]